MYHVADAGYLCGDRQGCMKGTRRDVLFQLEQWSKDEQDKRVFWLNGLAGTGKSTIAQTFAEMCFADGKLGASFFCSRDFDDRSNLRSIFPTLAFQLAHRYPQFRRGVASGLDGEP
jgi:adenylylsulfate kinase-like enzyme